MSEISYDNIASGLNVTGAVTSEVTSTTAGIIPQPVILNAEQQAVFNMLAPDHQKTLLSFPPEVQVNFLNEQIATLNAQKALQDQAAQQAEAARIAQQQAIEQAKAKEAADILAEAQAEVQKTLELANQQAEVTVPTAVDLAAQQAEAQKAAELAAQQAEVVQQNIDPTINAISFGPSAATNEQVLAVFGLTPSQLDTIKATIRHEAGANLQEIANVASCIKNRMLSGAWGGTNPFNVVTAKGQFESYLKGFYNQYANGNYGGPDVDALINGILLGTILPTHGYQSFRGKNSPNGVQLVPGGNKYR